jgi:hypothetical protein
VLQYDDGLFVHNLGEGCSKDAGEGIAAKNPHDDIGLSHFAKIIMELGDYFLPIPDAFRRYLGTIPKIIVLKTNTDCSWMVVLKDANEKIAMDQGWTRFAILHDIKIGYFMAFKALKGDVYKVTIFDYNITELVKK